MIKTIKIIKNKLYFYIESAQCWRKSASGIIKLGKVIPFKYSHPLYHVPLFGLNIEYLNGQTILVGGIQIELFGYSLSLTIHYYKTII